MKATFQDGFAVGFKMAVGEFFRDKLRDEEFRPGDIIHDSPLAYSLVWSEALRHINCSFQVVEMADAKGDIEYDVLVPNAGRSKLVKHERIKEPVAEFIRKLKQGYNAEANIAD